MIQELVTVGQLKRKLRDLPNKTKVKLVVVDDESRLIRMEGMLDTVSLPTEEEKVVILFAGGTAQVG